MNAATGHTPDFTGLKLLVVEDNFLIAEMLRSELCQLGCLVKGPAGRVPDALRIVDTEELDGALLDIDLGGEMSFPVAVQLSLRGVPFGFVTGYADSRAIPEKFRHVPCLAKPFTPENIADFIARHFCGGGEIHRPQNVQNAETRQNV